jgi:hypothetical protein
VKGGGRGFAGSVGAPSTGIDAVAAATADAFFFFFELVSPVVDLDLLFFFVVFEAVAICGAIVASAGGNAEEGARGRAVVEVESGGRGEVEGRMEGEAD